MISKRESVFNILNTHPTQHFYHSTMSAFTIVVLIIITS